VGMREFGANLRLFEMILTDVSHACSLNNDPNRTQCQGCIKRGGQTLLVDSSMFGVVMVVMRKKRIHVHSLRRAGGRLQTPLWSSFPVAYHQWQASV